MNRFDDELRGALRRVDPPPGFTERVLARVSEERARPGWRERFRRVFGPAPFRLAAAGALALVIVAGVGYEHLAERRARGEQAKQQVLLALKITARQLQIAERGVERLNARQPSSKETIR